MLSKKKKFIVLGVMVALLAVTAYLNIALNNRVVETNVDVVTSGNFFSTYRTDRKSTRDSEIAYYEAIIASETTTEEARAEADKLRLELVSSMESELVMEGLIKAKGFEDVIVTNSASNINVVIKSAELSESEVAQIVDVIQDQTGADIDNIKIIPVE